MKIGEYDLNGADQGTLRLLRFLDFYNHVGLFEYFPLRLDDFYASDEVVFIRQTAASPALASTKTL